MNDHVAKLWQSYKNNCGTKVVWYKCLNIYFQFLNNIIRISIHFFLYKYFKKTENYWVNTGTDSQLEVLCKSDENSDSK